MLKINESLIVELLTDPVMAASVLMGWELDTFQAARLRYYWFVPDVIDSSGVSTGKTLLEFIFVNLRCLLLTDHRAAVYFPNFQTMKDEFWPYFRVTVAQSPIYREQLLVHNKRLGERLMPGAWAMEFKNGNRIIAPAPNFLKDADTSASRRFNTLVVDDWLRAEDMGDAISKQLLDRVTRPCFNQNHPVWANHTKLLGHAERPMHKGYVHVKAYKRFIRDGSQAHALISFCHRDYSEEFAARHSGVRPDHRIRNARATLSKDQYRRQWLGLWSRDGSTYYPEVILMAVAQAWLHPRFGRQFPHEQNFLGFDTAPGMKITADWSAAMVLRLVELVQGNGVDLPHNWTDEASGRAYHRAFVFAHQLQAKRAAELAAFIHLLHQVFVFERMVLDPGGGGLFVYSELKQPRQKIDGVERKVTPLCDPDEMVTVDKLPIVRFFKRSHFPNVLEPGYYLHDGSFLAGMHLKYRESWEERSIHLPLPARDRNPAEMRLWTPEQAMAQKNLDIAMEQMANVRQVTDSDGRTISARGFPVFTAVGKKDLAYAGLYAHTAALGYFAEEDFELAEEESTVVVL